MTTYWCEHAWLPPGEVHHGVTVEVEAAGITATAPGTVPPPDARVLPGLTLPGLANAHSHAFHRALRGRTQRADRQGSFWTWREQMYQLAGRLELDSYAALARATYAEMARAGITCVAEFHYLHHRANGQPYADPNAMAHVLIAAARAEGLRIALLDACYLIGGLEEGIGQPLAGVQARFGDGTAARWAERVEELRQAYDSASDVVVGAAVHSVRAVPPDQLGTIAHWAAQQHAPLHVHLSEQPRENTDCLEAYGRTPTRLLDGHGLLGPRTTAVHATHLDPSDVDLLGTTGTTVALCPTTERDLADGIGPAADLHRAGSPLALGSDSHAVIDLLEEARAVELNERLRTGVRGHWAASDLIRAATEHGHAASGFTGAGILAPGAWADLVTVRLDSVRTAGADPAQLAEAVTFAGTASDITHVVASGRELLPHPELPAQLAAAIRTMTDLEE